jgi:hypothetical protein
MTIVVRQGNARFESKVVRSQNAISILLERRERIIGEPKLSAKLRMLLLRVSCEEFVPLFETEEIVGRCSLERSYQEAEDLLSETGTEGPMI